MSAALSFSAVAQSQAIEVGSVSTLP